MTRVGTRRCRRLRALTSGFVLMLCGTAATAQQTQCQPADSNSANLIQYVTYVVTSIDPGMSSMRSSLGLTGVNPSSITLASDSKTCKAAAEALDALAGTPQSGRKVFVVKAGTFRYVVEDAAIVPPASRGSAFVFDRKFVFIRALLR